MGYFLWCLAASTSCAVAACFESAVAHGSAGPVGPVGLVGLLHFEGALGPVGLVCTCTGITCLCFIV